jgi:hypothetical protein
MIGTGQPLLRSLPGSERLLEDPEGYLAEAPVEVGPVPAGRLALVLWLAAAALAWSAFGLERVRTGRLAAGVGLGVLAVAFTAWWLRTRGHRLILRRDGAEVIWHGLTVWAPWAVFRSRRLVVREEVPGCPGWVVPIDPAAVGRIELRRGGEVVARGEEAQGPQWRLADGGEAVLPGRYEASSAEVAELLRWLGGRLGGDGPQPDPPPPPPGAWTVVPLGLLRLPWMCARCAGQPEEVARSGRLEVPLCGRCRGDLARRASWWGVMGLLCGGALGSAAGSLDSPGWGVAGTVAGLAVGALVGLRLGSRPPVRLRHHSPWRGVAAVRFDHPVVEAAALGPLRSAPGEPGASAPGVSDITHR